MADTPEMFYIVKKKKNGICYWNLIKRVTL